MKHFHHCFIIVNQYKSEHNYSKIVFLSFIITVDMLVYYFNIVIKNIVLLFRVTNTDEGKDFQPPEVLRKFISEKQARKRRTLELVGEAFRDLDTDREVVTMRFMLWVRYFIFILKHVKEFMGTLWSVSILSDS